MRRHWVVTGVGVLLALMAVALTWQTVAPGYKAESRGLLVQPKLPQGLPLTPAAANPYADFNPSLLGTAQVLAEVARGDAAQKAVRKAGGPATYAVATTGSTPVLVVTATGSDSAGTAATARAVLGVLVDDLDSRQSLAGVPPDQRLRLDVLANPSRADVVNKARLKASGAAGVLVGLLVLGTLFVVDALRPGPTVTRRAAGVADRADSPPEPEPEPATLALPALAASPALPRPPVPELAPAAAMSVEDPAAAAARHAAALAALEIASLAVRPSPTPAERAEPAELAAAQDAPPPAAARSAPAPTPAPKVASAPAHARARKAQPPAAAQNAPPPPAAPRVEPVLPPEAPRTVPHAYAAAITPPPGSPPDSDHPSIGWSPAGDELDEAAVRPDVWSGDEVVVLDNYRDRPPRPQRQRVGEFVPDGAGRRPHPYAQSATEARTRQSGTDAPTEDGGGAKRGAAPPKASGG